MSVIWEFRLLYCCSHPLHRLHHRLQEGFCVELLAHDCPCSSSPAVSLVGGESLLGMNPLHGTSLHIATRPAADQPADRLGPALLERLGWHLREFRCRLTRKLRALSQPRWRWCERPILVGRRPKDALHAVHGSPRTSTNSVGEVDLDHSTDGAALHAGRRRGAPSAGFQRLLLRGFVSTTCQKGALESQR